MSILRPRSVLQLVLVGFCAALAPLIFATLFTLNTLDKLAVNSRQSAALLVDVTRLAQDIDGDLIELERRAGQYYALLDPALAELFGRERSVLLGKLANLQSRIQLDGPEIQRLMDAIDNLELDAAGPGGRLPDTPGLAMQESRLTAFAPIIELGKALQSRMEAYVDDLLKRNASDTKALLDQLVFQLVFFHSRHSACCCFSATG